MEQLRKNWWKVLPFFLFFLGLRGVILLILFLIIYGISHFVPVDPKRGKLLTWLIIIDVISLAKVFILTFISINHLSVTDWFTMLNDIFGTLCLIGIWNWKKMAVFGFIIFTIIDFIITGSNIPNNNYPWFVDFSGVIFALAVWLCLWILAFKRKWSFFN